MGLVQDLHKELAAVRQEINNLKGERGRGQGEHDRRIFFEKNFVDKRHDRGRGQRGKGKGKGNFYRVGAKNNVDSAFHVATETFVPACKMPECVGCYHAASDCPTLSMNLYNADDDAVRHSYLAEFVTAEMQNAYDNEDDAAFDDICEHYGKAEVHKGPSASTFPSTAEPTVTSHFDAFAVDGDAIVETVTEDCDDVFEDAMAAEVVSDLPPESFVEDFVYRPPSRSSDIDKFHPPFYKTNSLAYFEPEDIATPPQPPPPQQKRIGGGGRVGLLHTALLTTFFFSAFMCAIEECDATAVTVQLAQPLTLEHACDFATPPAQGLVVSQHAYDAFDAFPEDFYEDPGPGNNEIESYIRQFSYQNSRFSSPAGGDRI